VLFGVLLSTLHQSSLGAVYLIAPKKLSPFWYNSQVPTLFLISAVMMGLSMVSLETILSEKFFKHKADPEILYGLARGVLVAGVIYLAAKLWFLFKDPGIAAAFNGTMEANMFLLEMIVSVVAPVLLLALKSIRENVKVIFLVNIMVVAGVLLNRLNVSVFGVYRSQSATGFTYFPTWMEIVVTLAFICFSIIGFKVCVKYLRVFPETETQH
jgi:Ni/Fe-hydrogenase subunit HybB-like protein